MESAKEYPSISSATYALAYRRKFRDWANAKVLPKDSPTPQERESQQGDPCKNCRGIGRVHRGLRDIDCTKCNGTGREES